MGRFISFVPSANFEEDASYEVKHVLSHECRGPHSCPRNSISLKWLGYALQHNYWEPEGNLGVEVLKEGCSSQIEDRLTHHDVKRDCEAPVVHKHLRQKVSNGRGLLILSGLPKIM